MTTMTTHHPPSLAEMRDKASPVPRIAGHHDHQCPLIPHLKHGRVINLATFPLVKPFWPPLSLKTQDRSDHCAITASPILKPRRPAFIFGSGTHLHPLSLPLLMEGGWVLGHHHSSIAQNAIWKASTASHNVCKWVQMLLSGITSTLLIYVNFGSITCISSCFRYTIV